ncbi:MAG TPA: transcriptional repressor [Candidatus Limnocylindrales bacterium]|nr:transcriptional repressor [Candidatus Limnocylindrales bacterium]
MTTSKSRRMLPAAAADGFAQRCRAAGLADTPQRRVIYRCLAESLDHPTAEAVYLRVKPHLPKVSLATVYRNLKLFAEAGIIDEVATGSSLARYDANQDQHHHLICKSCGSVADYYDDRLDGAGVLTSAAVIDGFEVHGAKVNVFGLCSACRPSAARSESGRSPAADVPSTEQ